VLTTRASRVLPTCWLCASLDEEWSARAGRTVVIGVGNRLMGDEGIGVRVVEELKRRSLPDDVDVVDAGTIGLDLLFVLEGYARAVIVDAAEMGLPAGEVRVLGPADLAEAGPVSDAHGMGVAQVLELAEAMGLCPANVVLVGVQPDRVGPALDLSKPVEAALAGAVRCVEALVRTPGDGAARVPRSGPWHE